jgi:Phage integrase family
VVGLEHEYARPHEVHVEWQLRELNGRFYRLPPKDDSYRSPEWAPGLPVDLPPFLSGLLAAQVKNHSRLPCGCASEHGGSGRYVFLGPDGGHYRRSNYCRRVFRPACDGRHLPISGAPGRLVIAKHSTAWPGTPVAAWPPATNTTSPDAGYANPRGHGIAIIREDTPLACWLPIKLGLTPHGLRHSHRTWMAEEGTPEIHAEQRLGHQVPGMRGLYTHVSDRMRAELMQALQDRWEESLSERAALNPRSPVPLLDELLPPLRTKKATEKQSPAPRQTTRQRPARGDREKMSQIPPKSPERRTQTPKMGRNARSI